MSCDEPETDTPSTPVVSVQQALKHATFSGIGDLPGGEFLSEAHDVDATGERVVGVGTSTAGTQAVAWTRAGGLFALEDGGSASYAISDSGCVVVGSALNFRAPQEGERTMAARWVGSAAAEFAPQPLSLYQRTEAIAISGDGGTIIARAFTGLSPSGFIWRGDEFSNTPPDNAENLAANEDGGVVVGRTTPSRSGGPSFALRNGEVLPYPFEPECGEPSCAVCITPGECIAEARGVSADGSIVVGSAVHAGVDGPRVAVQWVVQGGEVSAAILSDREASARAVSADGRVVAGSETYDGQSVATRWVDGHAESIALALERQGVSTAGWQLTSASNVSADGESIVGAGLNPDGNPEGWVARLAVD